LEIDHIDHFVITAADVDATCEFYTRVLGMTVKEFGEGRKALHFGDQKINVHPPVGEGPTYRAQRPSIGGYDFCFITQTPIVEVVAHLRAQGVRVEEGPGERSGAVGPITSVYFRDPDGNLVEVSNYG
jgi:catechol 2,3-dioxygenase-like lactoylglutathione lyase family enzyme